MITTSVLRFPEREYVAVVNDQVRMDEFDFAKLAKRARRKYEAAAFEAWKIGSVRVLEEIEVKKHWSQTEIAQVLGRGDGDISKWLNANSIPARALFGVALLAAQLDSEIETPFDAKAIRFAHYAGVRDAIAEVKRNFPPIPETCELTNLEFWCLHYMFQDLGWLGTKRETPNGQAKRAEKERAAEKKRAAEILKNAAQEAAAQDAKETNLVSPHANPTDRLAEIERTWGLAYLLTRMLFSYYFNEEEESRS